MKNRLPKELIDSLPAEAQNNIKIRNYNLTIKKINEKYTPRNIIIIGIPK